jgi:hypothetical protein
MKLTYFIKSFVAFLLFSSLCSCDGLPVFAEETKPGYLPAGPESSTGPELKIVRPQAGERFTNGVIVVELDVQHFELAEPEPCDREPSPKPIGHVHIFLDSNPLIATSSKRHMFGSNDKGRFIRSGRHYLIAELVHDNHEVLNPRVWQSHYFYTGRKNRRALRATGDGGSKMRIYRYDIDEADLSGIVQ